MQRRRRARRPQRGWAPLRDDLSFTIGYQGRTVGDYLGMLSRAQVTVLCDVRRNAISRKRGFSKRALAGACEQIDIRYEHLPDLGIGAERRRLVRTDRDRQLLLAEYLRVDLAPQALIPGQDRQLGGIRRARCRHLLRARVQLMSPEPRRGRGRAAWGPEHRNRASAVRSLSHPPQGPLHPMAEMWAAGPPH